MKTYTSGTDLIMVEGEIAIIKLLPKDISDINTKHIFFDSDSMPKQILASTKQLEGIPLLDRIKFVKPFDMEGMQEAYINENNLHECNFMDSVEDIIKTDFEDGYNANKAEFTKDDMIEAMNAVVLFYDCYPSLINIPEYIRGYLDGKQRLTLPKSIECDDNYNIIKIEF